MDKSIFHTYIEQATLKDLLQFEAYQDEVVRAQPENNQTARFAEYKLPEPIVNYLDFDHSLYARDSSIQVADTEEQALYTAARSCWHTEKEKVNAMLQQLK